MNNKSFAVRLRQARKQAKMTQRQAAAAYGASQTYWALMELGTRDPTRVIRHAEKRVEKIAHALGCDFETLLPRGREK